MKPKWQSPAFIPATTARCCFSEYKLLKLQAQIAAYETDIADLLTLLEDPEIRETAEGEIAALLKKKSELEKKLATSDPDDDKNAVVEIQAGTGGDEAALFAGDLYRMYELYCKQKKLSIEWLDFSEGNLGGFKIISFIIEGQNAHGIFKHESGVHRVQRVPKTETKGRVHTSTVSVVVMPEQTIEHIDINKTDVRMENFCAGGPGGQHQNKTQNAVRLTHMPTGVSVVSRTKSLQANLKYCWKMLATKINDMQEEKFHATTAQTKRQLRGKSARAEKIRTYNYPQDRVTDHRFEGGKYVLQTVIEGNLDQMLLDVQDNLVDHV